MRHHPRVLTAGASPILRQPQEHLCTGRRGGRPWKSGPTNHSPLRCLLCDMADARVTKTTPRSSPIARTTFPLSPLSTSPRPRTPVAPPGYRFCLSQHPKSPPRLARR